MIEKSYVSICTARCPDGRNLGDVQLQRHPSSRAMRLVNDPTRFLLVSVPKQVNKDVLRATLSRWVHQGVEIYSIRYRYLGFTESQVKAGRLVFFREDEEWNIERLLARFGDLPSVYFKSGYGKYAARLGLSFSSTVESLDIPHPMALQIPDLTAPDGSLYSDGCGMIRDSFAAQLCAKHDLPSDTTVFQVRRGGIKGLLVRYPDAQFDALCGTRADSDVAPLIAYRPSMYKYDGGPTVLELNNYNSSPAAARLNVQLVVLLLTLGVSPSVFQRLLQDQLDLIDNILTDRAKALAYIRGELDAAAEDSLNQGLYNLLLAGHDLAEPIVRQRLQRFQGFQYESLRKRMNLRVQDSCYIFGVVDEEGVLGPDEVYINLPSRSGVLVRDVVVSRTPSYHPGDIRRLRAVDRPELRHHRNCIVFPSTARHSVPDTMSSGDLDGDKYFVTWDPSLLPPAEAPPFNRAPSLTAQLARASSSKPIGQLADLPSAAVETFMQLKFNALMGRMANEWSQHVESSPALANAPYPLALVPLIEAALDIMKSGDDFARLRAEFNEVQSGYRRDSTSGFVSPIQQLRDMIPHTDLSDHTNKLSADRCDPALSRREEDPARWQHFLVEAREMMPRFNRDLRRAIILDEGAKEQDSESHRSLDEPPNEANRVKQEYQRRYFGGGCTESEKCDQRFRASAWYYYGYTQKKEAFAWLGERYLNEIKACEYLRGC
ncbi:RdRP-domain-containing protein [Lentinus tigrinus ALCF2SS1-7]|uniref:RNA-dependent RNA polymerase n=1 Tax=Lentinus tigrinus ALCF2SS1-6 TaxID=1328759 RepID=A0A5C2RTS5_9APHY|nr:RdRP-domain-containing protein [Lentinus tigrinus ALCF2SS1-6]RPD70350.1 RdRP-domain-containing protein [Lentinus tigrinus ALCF2SS1-7]